MPSPFAITVATSNVSLDDNRQGQTSFTVSNTTPGAIRGRAHLVAQPATASAWLKPQGEAERDFAGAGSQQYVVQIAVPPSAPAGDYTFRLDVVDVANPDDNFSEGPTVHFAVAAAPAPVKKPFPWWIVLVAVGVVIVLAGGIYGIIKILQKPNTPPTWTAIGTLRTNRVFLAAAVGLDGRIYAIGGTQVLFGQPLNTMEVYDPKTGIWTTNPTPIPSGAHWGLSAVTGSDGRIYVFSGVDSAGAQPATDAYDPKTGKWVPGLKPMPTARWLTAAAPGPDGRIYVFGGYNTTNSQPFSTVEAYDPKHNTWTVPPLTPMPTARGGSAAALGPDGRIYVFGGFGTSAAQPLSTVEAYNPAPQDNWTAPLKPMPTARWGAAAVTGPDGLIYVIGGFNVKASNALNSLNTVEAYNPRTNSWSTVPSMPTARGALAAVLGTDGLIYTIGGGNSNTTTNTFDVLKTVETYGVLRADTNSQLIAAALKLRRTAFPCGSIFI